MIIHFVAQPVSNKILVSLALSIVSLTLFGGCARTPPDYRPEVTLPKYSEGDAIRGRVIFEEACAQCHQLTPGLNKKGPQLMNIYGAKSAQLTDYDYSDGLKAAGWIWSADKLDPYIEDNEKVITDSKMLADPMPDASERADVIAYLSTLRAPVPALDADGFPIESAAKQTPTTVKADQVQSKSDTAIEIAEGEEHKPAADFQ